VERGSLRGLIFAGDADPAGRRSDGLASSMPRHFGIQVFAEPRSPRVGLATALIRTGAMAGVGSVALREPILASF
jgi:hypothetical protein